MLAFSATRLVFMRDLFLITAIMYIKIDIKMNIF